MCNKIYLFVILCNNNDIQVNGSKTKYKCSYIYGINHIFSHIEVERIPPVNEIIGINELFTLYCYIINC